MSSRFQSDSGLFGLFRRKAPATKPGFEAARARELAESMAILEARRRAERLEQRARRWAALWPLGVGLMLAILAPSLQFVAESIGPWAVTGLFPFVALAQRPEMQAGPITHLLPDIMLYAQFPIEGLLACIILRRRVRPASVAMQVLLFHFLGIAELWMLNGAARQLLQR